MARFRTIADFRTLTGDVALTEAEEALIAACQAGEPCVRGDGTRPETATADNTIRADLLRYLILGGCENCRTDVEGVQLVGAYVSGPLNMDFGVAVGITLLHNCRFQKQISALQTRFGSLILSGSACPGLFAQGAEVTGDVFLADGFHATGEVLLAGAKIGGQLACGGGRFDNAGGHALNAQGAEVTGGVFLRNKFHATGEVRLSGAKIGGQLDCGGGRFDNAGGDALNAEGAEVAGDVVLGDGFRATGEVSLSGAKIGGQLDCGGGRFDNAGGDAFLGQRMWVDEGFRWRKVTVDAGRINLASAHVGDLVDDLASWPAGDDRLYLDGFTYERISASFTDAPRRLDWLRRGTVWQGEFFPQPYAQLAKTLAAMGHRTDARKVRIAAEAEGRAARRNRRRHRRKFARLVSRLSAQPSRGRAVELDAYTPKLPHDVAEQQPAWHARFIALHGPQPEVANGPPPLDALTRSYAQQQFRNDLLWVIVKDRGAIAASHIVDQALFWIVGYGYAP